MPFADERLQVAVVDYRPSWVTEFDALAAELGEALGDAAVRIDHVGSTSVPGLPAKDRIDAGATDILMAAAERWAAETGWDAP